MEYRAKTALAAVAGIVLTGISVANAAPVNPAITVAVTQIGVGIGALHQNYKEDDDHGLVPTGYLDKEDGYIPAFSLNAGLVSQGGWYSESHFLYSAGKTDYDGYLQSGTGLNFTPYRTETKNRIFELFGNIGYLFGLGGRWAVAPKLEVGYLGWRREITGPYGSTTDYGYARFGGGAEVLFAATNRLVLSVEGIYAAQHGNVSSNVLDKSIGTTGYTRFTARADYRLTERWHIGASLARASYDSEESGVSSAGYIEPKSKTVRTLAMARIAFAF